MNRLIDLREADRNGYISPYYVPLMSKSRQGEIYKYFGARWDQTSALWSLKADQRPSAVKDILAKQILPTIIADQFYYAIAMQACWKCSQTSRVLCLACRFSCAVVSEPVDDEEDDGEDHLFEIGLQFVSDWITMSDCLAFDDDTEREIKTRFPHYYLDFSKTKNQQCFMNHCEHCKSKLGDWFMHAEPGGPFFPNSASAASAITLYRVQRPLLVRSGWQLADFLDQARLDFR